jgi:hypothetical protein
LLLSHSIPFNLTYPIKFEKNWLAQEDFVELFESWWDNFAIISVSGDFNFSLLGENLEDIIQI